MTTLELQLPKATILVADDEKITREFVAALLRSYHLEVETADTGKDALERIHRGGIDLVLLDIMMPGISGLDCCRIIKRSRPDTFLPVILLTARSDTDSRVEGLRIGADDYVCKPFDERELLARVHGMLRIKQMHDQVSEAKEKLEHLAVRDELTGLYNYRYLHSRLTEEFKRAERYRDPLACGMVDIDHFKQFNDQYGHRTGDGVLKEVGVRLKQALREVDVVARYGGEEFLLVLPSTHFAGSISVAERVLRSVNSLPVVLEQQEYSVTISLGVAVFPSRDIQTKDELLKSADAALYQAKADGRNRICVFQHQGYMYRPETQAVS